MPLPLTVSCFSKIQIGFTFLDSYGLTRVVLDKGPLNGCVCVCVYVRYWQKSQGITFCCTLYMYTYITFTYTLSPQMSHLWFAVTSSWLVVHRLQWIEDSSWPIWYIRTTWTAFDNFFSRNATEKVAIKRWFIFSSHRLVLLHYLAKHETQKLSTYCCITALPDCWIFSVSLTRLQFSIFIGRHLVC